MKATIIISVIVSSLFALLTTIEAGAFDPVVDYGTGNPISRRDGCVIRAFWNGQHFYVDKMDTPYVGLRLGPRPSRVVRLNPVREADRNAEFVKTSIKFRARFNDSINHWNDLTDLYRITETGGPLDGGAFVFHETKENRVYKMVYRFLNSKFYEVGMQVKNQNNEDRYYLATNRTRKNIPNAGPIPKEAVNHVHFTFETL